MNDEYRDEPYSYEDSAADAELDQVAAAIRGAAPMITMMIVELTRCGLDRETATDAAVKWYIASADSAS